jgi:hypothetical protein
MITKITTNAINYQEIDSGKKHRDEIEKFQRNFTPDIAPSGTLHKIPPVPKPTKYKLGDEYSDEQKIEFEKQVRQIIQEKIATEGLAKGERWKNFEKNLDKYELARVGGNAALKDILVLFTPIDNKDWLNIYLTFSDFDAKKNVFNRRSYDYEKTEGWLKSQNNYYSNKGLWSKPIQSEPDEPQIGIEYESLNEARANHPFVMEMSEGLERANVGVETFAELEQLVNAAGFTDDPTATYVKTYILLPQSGGDRARFRIDASKKDGDYNFETQGLADFLDQTTANVWNSYNKWVEEQGAKTTKRKVKRSTISKDDRIKVWINDLSNEDKQFFIAHLGTEEQLSCKDATYQDSIRNKEPNLLSGIKALFISDRNIVLSAGKKNQFDNWNGEELTPMNLGFKASKKAPSQKVSAQKWLNKLGGKRVLFSRDGMGMFEVGMIHSIEEYTPSVFGVKINTLFGRDAMTASTVIFDEQDLMQLDSGLVAKDSTGTKEVELIPDSVGLGYNDYRLFAITKMLGAEQQETLVYKDKQFLSKTFEALMIDSVDDFATQRQPNDVQWFSFWINAHIKFPSEEKFRGYIDTATKLTKLRAATKVDLVNIYNWFLERFNTVTTLRNKIPEGTVLWSPNLVSHYTVKETRVEFHSLGVNGNEVFKLVLQPTDDEGKVDTSAKSELTATFHKEEYLKLAENEKAETWDAAPEYFIIHTKPKQQPAKKTQVTEPPVHILPQKKTPTREPFNKDLDYEELFKGYLKDTATVIEPVSHNNFVESIAESYAEVLIDIEGKSDLTKKLNAFKA